MNNKNTSSSKSIQSSDNKMRIQQISDSTTVDHEKLTLLSYGYKREKLIASTLQGEVFTARNHENKCVVVKKTNKNLHLKGISITNGKIHHVKENIVKEAYLLKSFMLYNPPNCIKFYDFLEDKQNFYLIMENGGKSLFEFTINAHRLIDSNKLSLKYWRQIVRFIFAQMVEFIYWMHHKMHCCNLDISLENILISPHVNFDEMNRELNNCTIKFIDFGVTESFQKRQNPNFICSKHVGKSGYSSPQIHNKNKTFFANKSDIWSLGVCLFSLLVGGAPYRECDESDSLFQKIKSGNIKQLLLGWNRLHYVTNDALHLLNQMLCCDESKRIDIDGVAKHNWLQPCVNTKKSRTK